MKELPWSWVFKVNAIAADLNVTENKYSKMWDFGLPANELRVINRTL